MKVKKIGALCKARGTCYLFDELAEGGEIIRQWISNGAAMWPVSGLPMLREANLSTLFDFSESAVEKMKIAEKELPGWLCGVAHDLRDGEAQMQESNIHIRVDGEELMALTAGASVYWLKADYLKPCWTKETVLLLRKDEDGEAKHREAQERGVYRRLCSICVREYYDSLVGPCPERDGRQVCMYCCRMCEHHYTLPGQIGQRCRAKDAARGEKRGGRGTKAPSVAARQLPPGGSQGRERDRCGGDEGRKEMTA